jgi:hypothetical protein
MVTNMGQITSPLPNRAESKNPLTFFLSPFADRFSAEGAMSASGWGLAPGIRLHQQQALKARFNQAAGSNGCRK